MELTAEQFLRDKLESEIGSFGDGTKEFHTRDIEHLLKCLDDKDKLIKSLKLDCAEFIIKINWNAEKQFEELLTSVMTINNLSAEQRLYSIRSEYKKIWTKINEDSKTSK